MLIEKENIKSAKLKGTYLNVYCASGKEVTCVKISKIKNYPVKDVAVNGYFITTITYLKLIKNISEMICLC